MGAKKAKGKGGKGKKEKGGGEFGLKPEEQNQVYEAMREALASKLIRETDMANVEKKDENESRMRRLALERRVAQQKKIQMDIISDMTRQYKSVEEDLTN